MGKAPATESNTVVSRARLPYKFTRERTETLLRAAAKGYPQGVCAELAGLSPDTLSEWLRNADEHPEMTEFSERFKAARASKVAELHDAVDEAGNDAEGEYEGDRVIRHPRKGDWKARQWILQVISPAHRNIVGAQLGLKPTEDGAELSEKQIHHRVIQMIAFPTDEMQGLLRQALARGNPVLQAIVEEHVDERRRMQLEQSSVETTGEEFAARQLPEAEPEADDDTEEHDPNVRRAPMTPELEYRLSEFRRVLKKYDRIAMGGIPMSGKSLFLLECKDRPIVHTDDYIGKGGGWEGDAALAAAACTGHNRYLLVGIRATGCIRNGLNAEVLVWLGEPMEPPLSAKHQATAKGRETALRNLMELRPDLKVVRI